MKELSTEEKAKRYDLAIEAARCIYNNMKDGGDFGGMENLEVIFPELKESEDEQHRKWILEYLYDGLRKSDEQFKDHFKCAIAWLEKQGEKKSIDDLTPQEAMDIAVAKCFEQGEQKPAGKVEPKFKIGDKIENIETGEIDIVTALQLDDSYCFGNIGRVPFSKQNNWILAEQKPAGKVEPKFNIGDWVVYDHNAYQVVELPKEGYINLGLKRNGKIEFAPSTYCRPWTTQDAKDGDVLVTGNKNIFIFKSISGYTIYDYCGLYFGKFEESTATVNGTAAEQLPVDYVPATKEQRDTLFAKMKEAGYEWDAEKKELKKISQEYPLTPDECIKPAWSEEDENMFENTIGLIEVLDRETKGAYITKKYIKYLKSLKDRIQPKQEWSEEDKEQLDRALYMMEQLDMTKSWDDVYNWLKLLKYRYTWKPSDEQMDALRYVTNFDYGGHKATLVSLYEQLKKLKG